ncbi:amidohydrolase family protein [Bradyrhizobium sp. dw_78]|uniref:amidohydrolase family protein n=1 Tax=Bradyrhizobium sp. dw_78 TaxID=2719793 RepID=UPI001BD376D8|nr:amidohydrolase family protein [Bradyrhizobium sp. dw_78]
MNWTGVDTAQGHGSLLISGARVLDPYGELHRPPVTDILVEQGRIVALGGEAHARGRSAQPFDARGHLITPGFVNAHCHSHDMLLRGLFEQKSLESWGMIAFPFNWPSRGAEEIALRTRAHGIECLLGGMTTIQDMVTLVDFKQEHAEAVVDAYSQTGIEAVIAPQFSDLPGVAGIPFAEECFSASELAALGGGVDFEPVAEKLKSIFKHVSAPRLSWALGPVQLQICSDDALRWTADHSAETGLRIYTHLYETRSEAVLARHSLAADSGSAVRRLARLGIAGARLTIAHGVWIAPDEIRQLAEAGVGLAANTVTNLKLMNGFAPIRGYSDEGMTIGLGCDNSSASDAQNIFQAMKTFALIRAMQSAADDESAASEAFRAATVGGARLLGLQDEVGRIAPGYRANLAFIDVRGPAWRPFNSAVRQLVYGEPGSGVSHVMVRGTWVVKERKSALVDEASLCRELDQTRDRMQRDLEDVWRKAAGFGRGYAAVARRVADEPLGFDARSLKPPAN